MLSSQEPLSSCKPAIRDSLAKSQILQLHMDADKQHFMFPLCKMYIVLYTCLYIYIYIFFFLGHTNMQCPELMDARSLWSTASFASIERSFAVLKSEVGGAKH